MVSVDGLYPAIEMAGISPDLILNRHAIPEKMPDEGVLRCACNIGPREYLDREPLTRLHQQIKSKSGEVFARALVLSGRNHKDVDI